MTTAVEKPRPKPLLLCRKVFTKYYICPKTDRPCKDVSFEFFTREVRGITSSGLELFKLFEKWRYECGCGVCYLCLCPHSIESWNACSLLSPLEARIEQNKITEEIATALNAINPVVITWGCSNDASICEHPALMTLLDGGSQQCCSCGTITKNCKS